MMASSTPEPLAEKLPANAEHAAPTAWSEARSRIAERGWYWLATHAPDGRPHVRPVLAVWLEQESRLCFVSNPSSRKARNLARDPRCSLSIEAPDAHLVVEGRASVVHDATALERIAAAYATKYQWYVRIRGAAFDADYGAPTAGPPPYNVYALEPERVFGFGVDETWSPTRWRF